MSLGFLIVAIATFTNVLGTQRRELSPGVYGMSRQIGTAVGVALMVALLAGTADGALGAASFVPVWGLCGGLALATAVAFAAMGRVRARGAAEVAAPRTVAISAGSA